jgi:hypothetical protein
MNRFPCHFAGCLTLRILGAALLVFAPPVRASETRRAPLPQALRDGEFATVTAAVDRALAWLATQQEADGAFETPPRQIGQPGVTALAVMSLLSRGHVPGVGPYGEAINRAIDFTLSCQKAEGLVALRPQDPRLIHTPFGGDNPEWEANVSQSYNHAVALLMLGEVYGQTSGTRNQMVKLALEKGLRFTHALWKIRPKQPGDEGGWRYLRPWQDGIDSDLSVTAWHTLSLRSAANAGFDVPKEIIEAVQDYVLRCYHPAQRSFGYLRTDHSINVGLTGAGALCLSLGGRAEHPAVTDSLAMVAGKDFENPATFRAGGRSWPYYACYYLSQAAAQTGGKTWTTLYPKCSAYLLRRQSPQGFWPPEGTDSHFGPVYATSMAVLALTPQFQLLPIYQH